MSDIPSAPIRLLYGMMSDPTFSFNYFNREEKLSIKKGGKSWEIMTPQMDYLYSLVLSDYVCVASGRSVGKCEKADNYIENEHGIMQKLSDFPDIFKVQTYNQATRQIYWADAFKEPNGVKPCYQLTLDGGWLEKVTDEHPYRTMYGWRAVKDLKIGDFIAQPKQICEPLIQNNDIPDDELKLIGYLIADGGLTSNGISFTKINIQIIKEVKEIVKKYDCRLLKRSRRCERGNYRISKIKNSGKYNKLITLLKENGLMGCNGHGKHIPDKYLSCNNNKLALLLNRMFAGDGWVEAKRIGYCSVSERLVKQIQLLLLRFGIRSTYTTKRVKYNGGINIAYQMSISEAYLATFYDKIGVFTKLKPQMHISECNHKYEIPMTLELYKELKSLQKVATKELDAQNCRLRPPTTYGLINEFKLRKYLKINGIDEVNYKHLWENITWVRVKRVEYIGMHDTIAITVPETHTHILNGILSHNTSSIEHAILSFAITHPKKWTGYVVRNKRHANVLEQHLVAYFNKNPLLTQFFINYDKKDRIFHFTNGHKVEIRIVGTDKTGSTTLVSGHYDFLIVDEAQLLLRILLEELLPAMKEGCKVMFAGVPNDIRDTILYRGCSDEKFTYIRYASWESADWDESKRELLLREYGGEDSQAWRNLCGGFWGESAASVFRPSKLVDNARDITTYRYKSYSGKLFDILLPQMNIPPIAKKYDYFVIGGDMGYTSNSPANIMVWGAYKDKDITNPDGKIDHYDMIYRLELNGMTSYDLAKTIDYLIGYFNTKFIAFDAQNMGFQVYSDLCNKEIFPLTYLRNKTYVYPVMFASPISKGVIEEFDHKLNKTVTKEHIVGAKVASTDKLVELLEADRIHIPLDDAQSEDHDDIITIMQAEAATSTNNRMHPKVYSNSVNTHLIDAMRCIAISIHLFVEGRMHSNTATGTVRPSRLNANVFGKGGSKLNLQRRLGRGR